MEIWCKQTIFYFVSNRDFIYFFAFLEVSLKIILNLLVFITFLKNIIQGK